MKTNLEPSNVSGSPYIYLTFFLTHHEFNGPHIVVSDAKEYEDDEGILVGMYPDDDYDNHDDHEIGKFPDLQSALLRVKELADEAR